MVKCHSATPLSRTCRGRLSHFSRCCTRFCLFEVRRKVADSKWCTRFRIRDPKLYWHMHREQVSLNNENLSLMKVFLFFLKNFLSLGHSKMVPVGITCICLGNPTITTRTSLCSQWFRDLWTCGSYSHPAMGCYAQDLENMTEPLPAKGSQSQVYRWTCFAHTQTHVWP